MKKILALLAVVLGVVSCQTEPEGLDVNVGGEQEVAVCVSLPEATRANSAVGAFENVDLENEFTIRYILQVYYNGQPSKERLVKYSDDKSVVFPVRLVPGRDYNFVVWADIVEDGDYADNEWSNEDGLHYNTTDLHNITLKQTWVAMDETRDAFTGYYNTVDHNVKYSSTLPINITLKRPFAKLRVITTDMVELGYLGIEPYKGTVKYTTKHRESFNACNGTYGEQTKEEVTLVYNIAQYADNNEHNMVLFTDYFFADNDVVKFTMDIKEANNESIKKNNFNTDIAVQRNYLTTIQGNILTDGNNVTVKVEDAFVNGSEWNPGDDKYDVEVWDGKSISAPSQDSEGNYTVKTASELAWLAAAVNGTLETRAAAADSFAGKTFVLTQDIDLGNEPWTPIGNSTTSFQGTFDGNDKTIANLVVNGYNTNVGLFGFTTNGEIKNVTIENAKVSGRLNVGVVAGTPYTSKYTNITVKGHVEVNGMAYVGGVGGKDAYADWTNITVNVDETSYVKANSVENGTAYRTYVGGVVGFNGEGGHSFKNITSNIDVTGSTIDVGGLFGIAHYGNKFENCSCSGNVTITTDDVENALQMGGIAGVWNNGGQDVVFTNCSFTGELSTPNITEEVDFYYNGLIGAPYSATGTGKLIVDGYEMVANGVGLKDGVYYVMSAQGLVWVEAQEDKYFAGKTIKLANDIDMTGVTIANPIKFWDGRTTFDGQNHTISNLTMSTDSTEKKPFSLFGGTADIKNVKFDNAKISGYSYVAVVAGNLYGNIENCHVSNSSVTCTYWMAGAMSGQYNAGNVTNCSVTNTTITGPAAVGALVGVINETAGIRCVENCTVKGCTVAQNGSFGGDYDAMFGAVVGLINIENSIVNFSNCTVENTTVKGVNSDALYGYDDGNNTVGEDMVIAKSADDIVNAQAGETITVASDITLTEEVAIPAGVIFNGNGKQINGTLYAGGNVTFVGHTKVTAFSASYYDRTITIGEGACLEITGTGRMSLAYGNTFNITGSIENAKTADKTTIQPSLIVPGGISITGGNNAALNVTNAYVKIGSTTSKPGVANGEFALNFDNAIVEFTNELGFYDPTGGVNPTFEMNIKDSVFTTSKKIFVTANSTVNVDNSVVTLGSYLANRGELNLTNGSVMTGATIQFGENGGNSGAITVDNSSFTINADSTGQAFDGKGTGSITAKNNAVVAVDYYKAMTITVDESSTFTGTKVQ